MIALGIHYLTKYAVATNLARQRAEWPPHPGRVFMAMAAAHFESGADPTERAALEWLEAAGAPALRASDADERSTVTAYAPANDVHGGILRRPRQDRVFRRTRPREESVHLVWDRTPTAEARAALDKLCSKVTRVGHSSSAVQIWVVPEGHEPAANWLPGDGYQDARLRVPARGTLRSLEAAFNGAAIREYDALSEALEAATGKERTRLKNEMRAKFAEGPPESRRPQIAQWQGYGYGIAQREEQVVVDGPFDENFVVLTKSDGSMLGLESTLQLTGALRNSAMTAAGKAPPEWISGHDAAGAPSQHPHLACFPLPYVGFEYADGHILGLGLAIPRELHGSSGSRDEELRRFLGALFFDPDTGEEREVHLWRTGVWRWRLEREKRERPPLSLQRLSWTKPSRTWASVTPVVLHHYPKKREGDVERIVREAFVSALLPVPEEVRVRSVSAVEGAEHAMSLPPFTEGGERLCRYQTHVVAQFAMPVRGPMLVGRGRYRGYGLFRPVSDREASS